TMLRPRRPLITCLFITPSATSDIYTLSLHDALPIFHTNQAFTEEQVAYPISGFERQCDFFPPLNNEEALPPSLPGFFQRKQALDLRVVMTRDKWMHFVYLIEF